MAVGDDAMPTFQEVDAELENLDQQRQQLRDRARDLMRLRHSLIVGEQLDQWGLTAEEYAEAKRASVESVDADEPPKPLHQCLNEARARANKARREAQTVSAGGVDLATKARGVN